jgi:hypothetical protein
MSTQLPELPEGYALSYAHVFNPDGRVVTSKWWMTASCRDAYAREEAKKKERFAVLNASRKAQAAPNAIRDEPSMTRQAVWQKAYRERKRLARLAAKVAEKKGRLCGCGEVLEKGKQLCPICRTCNRRETIRKSVAGWRKAQNGIACNTKL